MINKLKEDYENIEIPKDLEKRTAETIREFEKKNGNSIKNKVIYFFVSLMALMTLALNTSPAFAQTAFKIPVVGNICRIFTFREYEFEKSPMEFISVKIPNVEIEGNKELEERINSEIELLTNEAIEESSTQIEEYFEAVQKTGGKLEDYEQAEITADYDVKYNGDEKASFVIRVYNSLFASSLNEKYYNIDLKTGEDITLESLFGENYAEYISEFIRSEINNLDNGEKDMYFTDVDLENIIENKNSFYLSDDGNSVTIVFEKYEIAVGALGLPEFEIPVQ